MVTDCKKCIAHEADCDSPYALIHHIWPSELMLFWRSGYFEGFGFDSLLTVFTCALSLTRAQESQPSRNGIHGMFPCS